MVNHEQDKFYSPKEVVDRLKIENTVASAEISDVTPLIMAKVISTIANSYYPYIPIETLERLKDLPQRVIVTDLLKFNNLLQTMSERTGEKTDALYTYKGNFIIIKNPESMEYVWENISEETRQSWTQAYEDEGKAKKEMGENRFINVFIHETIHGFHPSTGEILLGFIEDGVSYYTREMTNEIGIVNFSLYDRMEADKYQDFVEKRGEKVHRVFLEPS